MGVLRNIRDKIFNNTKVSRKKNLNNKINNKLGLYADSMQYAFNKNRGIDNVTLDVETKLFEELLSDTPLRGVQGKGKLEESNQYYKSDFFGGEAVAEVLITEFLKASNEFKNYVHYELGWGGNTCLSKDFKRKGDKFITFRDIILRLGVPPKEWISSVERLDSKGRYKNVKNVYKQLGFKDDEIDEYFSRMLTLDKIFLNVDRHLTNFGVIYNLRSKSYRIPPIFDQGMSLGVGVVMNLKTKGEFVKSLRSNNAKVQPFSRGVNENASVVKEYKYNFDVKKFVKIHNKEIGLKHRQMVAFITRLDMYIPYDVNGVHVKTYIERNLR